MQFTRRDVVKAGSAVAVSASVLRTSVVSAASLKLGGYPFTLGVASGDPGADGFVLWTRLAPKPMAPEGGMPRMDVDVDWEVAEDQAFRRIVAKGRERAVPEWAHSVHVEVAHLPAGHSFFYRFHAAGETSPVGRTRTAPRADAQVAALRYAFTACQHYETGYYAGYRQMIADDPAFILFLGDYIYERAARDGQPRRHTAEEAADLPSYRRRHALYKLDPDLQAAHAAAPWLAIWDDHEVRNNYAGDLPPSGRDRDAFLLRRAAGYKAYYEHMPMRRSAAPVGPNATIYRTLDWGRLAQFQFLDTRQYRDFLPCADGGDHDGVGDACAERLEADRSLLGRRQEAWLMQRLSATHAQWNFLTQQLMMAEARRPDPMTGEIRYSVDGWDGYPAARDRILRHWHEAKVRNPIAIGGDSHAFIASDLGIEPDGPVVSSAFVGGSLTSTSGADFPRMVERSPRVRFADSERRGYSIVDVGAKETVLTMRATADATRADTTVSTLKRFAIENGRPGFHVT